MELSTNFHPPKSPSLLQMVLHTYQFQAYRSSFKTNTVICLYELRDLSIWPDHGQQMYRVSAPT